ncbi:MAG: ATP synthase F1 subunit delta [Fusobacterium gastrosuis]|uniref:ATP synthase F1 subunit delta n=1 Tax=Fusobacterium TaxID=848 RepID=UPI001F4FD0EC|nr:MULTISPECIES: ATP synthase F1 subunit delta [Fusobacterium]MCI7223220.1 ATP synthase F1 subunit delta [Fusobacterium sp.]MDD7409832.1 ATP synthase F1 subunit delta [Fusobacteriaceae bacterium]MDY4010061.1 ATP synthase F1 subunit delta [Fusobacterium gastrosuis]MDY5712954.1 ATP synthase F1 subunit delta [Fusobacterium gastrosuis]
MIDIQVGRRYSEAIYEIAEQRGDVKEVYEILNTVMELYINDVEFKNFLLSPLISTDEKLDFLTEVFKDASKENLEILYYIVLKNRIINIRGIVKAYLEIYYKKNSILDVKGIFTRELSEEQKEKLISKLSKKTGKQINLEVVVDKSILGGGILKIGDTVVDGSIRKDLNKWKEN